MSVTWAKTSRQSRGYGAAHDRMRAHLIATVVMCEVCKRRGRATIGTIADHIVPQSKGGSDERSNYQLLCRGCHDEKTARESAEAQGGSYRPKRAIGSDGWPI
jgi:5-methylcytosine-specific restriction enzyme A